MQLKIYSPSIFSLSVSSHIFLNLDTALAIAAVPAIAGGLAPGAANPIAAPVALPALVPPGAPPALAALAALAAAQTAHAAVAAVVAACGPGTPLRTALGLAGGAVGGVGAAANAAIMGIPPGPARDLAKMLAILTATGLPVMPAANFGHIPSNITDAVEASLTVNRATAIVGAPVFNPQGTIVGGVPLGGAAAGAAPQICGDLLAATEATVQEFAGIAESVQIGGAPVVGIIPMAPGPGGPFAVGATFAGINIRIPATLGVLAAAGIPAAPVPPLPAAAALLPYQASIINSLPLTDRQKIWVQLILTAPGIAFPAVAGGGAAGINNQDAANAIAVAALVKIADKVSQPNSRVNIQNLAQALLPVPAAGGIALAVAAPPPVAASAIAPSQATVIHIKIERDGKMLSIYPE